MSYSNYFKFYLADRFRYVRERKILIHGLKIRFGYRAAMGLTLLLIFALPYFQLFLHDEIINQSTKLTEAIVFNICAIVEICIFYFGSKYLLVKFHVDDDESRLKFLSGNQFYLILLLVICFISFILTYSLTYRPTYSFLSKFNISGENMEIKKIVHLEINGTITKKNNNKDIDTLKISDIISPSDTVIIPNDKSERNNIEAKKYWVNQSIISIFIFWSLGFFTLIYFSLKSRLSKKLKQGILNHEVYLYWFNFIKAQLLGNPMILLSAALFISLTTLSFILRGDQEIASKHFLYSVAFYSFWFTSLITVSTPFFSNIRKLNTTYIEYNAHRLKNAVLSNMQNHVVIIGYGNLGKILVRNTISDIHPEGYGSETLSPNSDYLKDKSDKYLLDYDLIINKNLEIELVSKRIVIVEKNEALLDSIYESTGVSRIGTLHVFPETELKIVMLGICGDANMNSVLAASRSKQSQLVVNTAPDSYLSLKLSEKYQDKKLILTVDNSATFEVLTVRTYHKPVYLIDTQQIEGIVLSQMLYGWSYTHLRNRINIKKSVISQIVKKRLYDLNKCKVLYDNSDLVRVLLEDDIGNILIVGNGRYIFNILQAVLLTTQFSLNIDESIVRDLVEKRIIIFTDDKKIQSELEHKCRVNMPFVVTESPLDWSFYLVRNKYTTAEESELKIKTYFSDISNFEDYLRILKECNPEFILLMHDLPFVAVEMFTDASNAVEVYCKGERKKPHIAVYSYRSDKYYLSDLFKKYYTHNCSRKELIGYPGQQMRDSRISKDKVSASQFASMMRGLVEQEIFNNNSTDGNVSIAEVSFSVIEKPAALAYVTSKLCGLELRLPPEKTIIPDFIYYYSSEENRYRDTFIFRATAKLTEKPAEYNLEDSIRYCFINCDEKYREDMEHAVLKNLGLRECEDYLSKTINAEFDAGMFSHYPISSILRHKEKSYDINKRRKRFFINELPYIHSNDKIEYELNEITSEKLLEIFNVSDFTVWAEGEESPGSYATILANLVLGSVEKSLTSDFRNQKIPQITFSTNRPSYDVKIDNGVKIVQDSFYIKLVSKSSRLSDSKKLIKCLKLKLTSKVETGNQNWIEYLFNLKRHLETQGGSYSIYRIENIFTEGTSIESEEGIIEISLYKKMDLQRTEPFPDFKIITKWVDEQGVMKDLPEMRCDYGWDIYKNDQTFINEFELVMIRDDIAEGAKSETYRGEKFGHFQNQIYLIDNL